MELFKPEVVDAPRDRRERLIYAAGLFDGEGYVGIQLQPRPKPTNPDIVAVTLVMKVQMTTPWGCDWMADLFGGRVYLYAGKRTTGAGTQERALYRWRLTAGKAAAALTELRPFLREKAAQVDLCLEARRLQCGRPSGKGVTYRPEDRARVIELHNQVKALKHA